MRIDSSTCLLIPAPAYCSCLLLLPTAPAYCSCLLLLPTAPASCSCLLLLPPAPASCSCLLPLLLLLLLLSPSHPFAQRSNVCHVVATVPGIERNVFINTHRTQFRMPT